MAACENDPRHFGLGIDLTDPICLGFNTWWFLSADAGWSIPGVGASRPDAIRRVRAHVGAGKALILPMGSNEGRELGEYRDVDLAYRRRNGAFTPGRSFHVLGLIILSNKTWQSVLYLMLTKVCSNQLRQSVGQLSHDSMCVCAPTVCYDMTGTADLLAPPRFALLLLLFLVFLGRHGLQLERVDSALPRELPVQQLVDHSVPFDEV